MALQNNYGFHTKDNRLLILSFLKIYIERYSLYVVGFFKKIILRFKDWQKMQVLRNKNLM